jgi:hypothetical protein
MNYISWMQRGNKFHKGIKKYFWLSDQPLESDP